MPGQQMRMHPTFYQSYGDRSDDTKITPLATYLLRLIHYKRTNLCVSADVTSTSELLRLAEEVGEHICILKTHADIVHDFGERAVRGLNEIAKRKKFLVFEDRKFGDIGNTVQQQYTGGPLKIVQWAPIINAHIFPGPAVITALEQAAQKATAAYHTSVATTISASPAPSAIDSGDGDISQEDDDYDDYDQPNSRRPDMVPQDDPNNDYSSDNSSDDEERKGRKHSVVSVSTTISTKTEAISPQPTLRPSFSRNSTTSSSNGDEDEYSPAELAKQLAELEPPTFARSLLLLAQMSSAGNFFTPQYTSACLHHAREHREFVMGFIAQQSLNSQEGDNFITMTPGVQLAAGGDAMGQQYNTPQKVVGEAGADVIIVGRGVYEAKDRASEAAKYRKQGWMAYEERLRAGRSRK